MSIKTISVGTHSRDMHDIQIYDAEGRMIHEHSGYAPNIPGFSGGDDINFDIDNETGMIIGWVPLTTATMREAFDIDEDDEDGEDQDDENIDDTDYENLNYGS